MKEDGRTCDLHVWDNMAHVYVPHTAESLLRLGQGHLEGPTSIIIKSSAAI
jgi:hypothetical protein